MISGVRHLGVPHKVCKKNIIHEHKNFVHDHHDHTMKVINDHKESCYTCNMMYFIFYGIFQIKWHLWPHFFRAFSLKYFIEYKIHHSVTVSHHALIITFMLWSWWSSCMKFLWSWITFFIYSLFMNPCLCTWTYLTNMPAGYINHFKIQHTWAMMILWCQIRQTWDLSKNLHDRIFWPKNLHILLKKKQCKCINISYFTRFFARI